jgi:SnoaL-like domain
VTADDVIAIEQLIRRSAQCNDRRDWAALAALYDVGASLTRPNGQRLEGREAIRVAYASAPSDRRTRHVCAGTVVEPDGADRATAWTSVSLYTWVTEPDAGHPLPTATGPAIGEFADTLVRAGTGWLLAERVATLSARA